MSEALVHDVQPNATKSPMLERFGNRRHDHEAQRLPQMDGGGVGLYHRVELHPQVSLLARPADRLRAERAPDSAALRLWRDHEAGSSDVRSASRPVGTH